MFAGYKKQFRIALIILLLAVIFGAGAALTYFIRYSGTSTSVCRKCHAELFELWKNSKGHPPEKANCEDCHARKSVLLPAEFLADDELTSQRCFECHQDVVSSGYILKKKVIKFNHRFHDQEGLKCVDCHREAGHEYQRNGTNRPGSRHCLNCHLKDFLGAPKNQKCLNCHQVMLAPGKKWR
ncbi:MAG: cytochrome c3 family protein [Candidatus Aminicenantales bacterium]